ncbi:MAG: hypothetical protein AB7W59_21295 [Acidimicrobiia bacterium]
MSVVGRSGDRCHCGGSIKPGGFVPLARRKGVAFEFKRCVLCNVGWTEADPGTAYRLYKVEGGKWRAKPI